MTRQSIKILDRYIELLDKNIKKSVIFYKQKKLSIADDIFAKTITDIDLFMQTVVGMKVMLRMRVHPALAFTEASLVGIMHDLLQARRQKNTTLVARLLEKDLLENLKEWKKEVLPVLSSQFNTFRHNLRMVS